MNKYHFFWKGILSQWTRTRFIVNNRIYHFAEQYMMAEKALLFKDNVAREMILGTKDVRAIKELGRVVKNFDQAAWDNYKLSIVINGNIARAKEDYVFSTILQNLRGKVLVEASPFDRIWGIGYDRENALANIDNWGQNLLGIALMKVQELLAMGTL